MDVQVTGEVRPRSTTSTSTGAAPQDGDPTIVTEEEEAYTDKEVGEAVQGCFTRARNERIHAGALFIMMKKRLRHGHFGDWLREWGISERTAQDWMTVARAYPKLRDNGKLEPGRDYTAHELKEMAKDPPKNTAQGGGSKKQQGKKPGSNTTNNSNGKSKADQNDDGKVYVPRFDWVDPGFIWPTSTTVWRVKDLPRKFSEGLDHFSESEVLNEAVNRNGGSYSGKRSKLDAGLCEWILARFGPNEGEPVLQLFSGAPVLAAVAAKMGHPVVGVDINSKVMGEAEKKISEWDDPAKDLVEFRMGDACKIHDLVNLRDFQFVFMCPPYYAKELYHGPEGD